MSLRQLMSSRVNPAGKVNGLIDFLEQQNLALSGDIELVVTPATLGSSAATVSAAIAGDGFTRDVTVELRSADGNRHTWFSGSFDIAVADVTAGDGVSAIATGATSVQLENGIGTVSLEYTGTWAAADTQTLTVTGGSVLGISLGDKTSVDTLIA